MLRPLKAFLFQAEDGIRDTSVTGVQTYALPISEKGIAAIAAAEGELPWRPDLGGQYPYADLSAAGGGFATLDYRSEERRVGKEGRSRWRRDLTLHRDRAARHGLQPETCTKPRVQ